MECSSTRKGIVMVPIRYQVVGEEDYAFVVEIDSSGKYVIQSGTYTTQPPRSGQLTELQEGEIIQRSEEHTSELQSLTNLVCRILLEKKIFLMIRRPPIYTIFPYTTLFRSACVT